MQSEHVPNAGPSSAAVRTRIVDDEGVNDLPPPPASAPRKVRAWLPAAAVPFLVSGFLGYQASYQESLGGLNTLGAALLAYVIGGLVVVIGLVGLGNALRPAGRGRMASRLAFAAAGLIAAGAAGGAAAVPLLDLGYHPPVVLEARGEASVTLDGLDTFEPRTSGRADCQSVADGTDVEGVSALSLGLLNGGLLRAGISLPAPGTTTRGSISLWIDEASLPEGSAQPFWDSLNPEIDAPPGGTTGRARFEGAAIHEDELMGPAAGSWPATLSGEIRWACGPWFAADATPPSATAAEISVDLSGVDWSPTPGRAGDASSRRTDRCGRSPATRSARCRENR